MIRSNRRRVRLLHLLFLCALAGLAAGGTLWAQTADIQLGRSVVGNGGGVSASAEFRMHGTVGQSAADQSVATSESFRLSSGFWYGARSDDTIYLPLIDR